MDDERDETLALRAAGGCRTSFARLLERHYDRIFRLGWRWSGSRDAAEDIAQDVTLKLASAIRSYRAQAAFTTWLHRIAYTTAIDYLRRDQRIIATEPSEVARLIDASAMMEQSDGTAVSLWKAVRSLPDQQRDAVLLVYGEDMSHAEAASVMGCSEKTVSWHVHEAKKRLKSMLEVTD